MSRRKTKRKPEFVMLKPRAVRGSSLKYWRFYSTGPWPFYNGGVMAATFEEAYAHFVEFAESAKRHRRES